MRRYAYLEKNILRKMNRVQEFTFKIATENVDSYLEWVVPGIKFYDYQKTKDNRILFSIYVYNFREGFKIIDVGYDIKLDRKEIILDFAVSDRKEELPPFDEKGIDSFLVNVVTSLKKNFDNQVYSKESRNIFSIIEKIAWELENENLAKEVKSANESHGLLYIGGVAVVCLGLLAYCAFRKSK